MIDPDERALAVLDNVLAGKISGRISEWPQLVEALHYLRRRLAQPDQSEPVAWRIRVASDQNPDAWWFSREAVTSHLLVSEPLYTHADRTQAPGESGAWVLVPKVPTEAMLDAGCAKHECVQQDPWYSDDPLSEGDARDVYAAIIAAAPTPPSVPGKGGGE